VQTLTAENNSAVAGRIGFDAPVRLAALFVNPPTAIILSSAAQIFQVMSSHDREADICDHAEGVISRRLIVTRANGVPTTSGAFSEESQQVAGIRTVNSLTMSQSSNFCSVGDQWSPFVQLDSASAGISQPPVFLIGGNSINASSSATVSFLSADDLSNYKVNIKCD